PPLGLGVYDDGLLRRLSDEAHQLLQFRILEIDGPGLLTLCCRRLRHQRRRQQARGPQQQSQHSPHRKARLNHFISLNYLSCRAIISVSSSAPRRTVKVASVAVRIRLYASSACCGSLRETPLI